MNDRDMPKADFVTSILLILFGSGALIEAIRMPRLEHLRINPYTVPGIVPGLLGLIIGTMGLVLLIRSLQRGGFRLGLNREVLIGFFSKDSTRRTVLTLVVCLIYASILLGRIPYIVATVLFVFAFIVLFEYPEAKKSGRLVRMMLVDSTVALVAGLVVAGVFQYVFLVKLP